MSKNISKPNLNKNQFYFVKKLWEDSILTIYFLLFISGLYFYLYILRLNVIV